MVMHHTKDPEIVFREAKRVAKEIVVIETSYTNPVDRIFTITSDMVGNLRVDANWNSYKKDKAWKEFFESHGFKIIESHKYDDKNLLIIPFLHILYYLKRK